MVWKLLASQRNVGCDKVGLQRKTDSDASFQWFTSLSMHQSHVTSLVKEDRCSKSGFLKMGQGPEAIGSDFPRECFHGHCRDCNLKTIIYSLVMHLSGPRSKLLETRFVIPLPEEPWQESCTVISEILLHESIGIQTIRALLLGHNRRLILFPPYPNS